MIEFYEINTSPEMLERFMTTNYSCQIPKIDYSIYRFYMRRNNRVYFKQSYTGNKLHFSIDDDAMKLLLSKYRVGQNIMLKLELNQPIV